jgi:cellulose synthase/poly-beta-1,6-N-acetylglucosamine synthase-like glycosyltransferase
MMFLGYTVLIVYAITTLWLMLNAMIQLHLLYRISSVKKQQKKIKRDFNYPSMLVQIPVYNEPLVVERLLEAVFSLDYPRHKLMVQILDDSNDETSSLIDSFLERKKIDNLGYQLIRRPDRKGFKAGALQYGLDHSDQELVSIFDADFIPSQDFLEKLLPYFDDPAVGLVQARWSHLNRAQNFLTRVQSILLDAYFTIEQDARYHAGYFLNFCGTAGIWRRQCIEESGGWDGSVLSEDLDLSYRAQMKGWKLVYDDSVEVPAELPGAMNAFKNQQFRWTKGIAQISRKNMRNFLDTSISFDKKVHGFFHLLGNLVFVCMFTNVLFAAPLLYFKNELPQIDQLSKYMMVASLSLVLLTLVYYKGATAKGNLNTVDFLKYYPLFLTVYMGMSVQNTIAIFQGFFGKEAVFIRTPKYNNSSLIQRNPWSWVNGVEISLFVYCIGSIFFCIYLNDYWMMLLLFMMSYGLGILLWEERLKHYFSRGVPILLCISLPVIKLLQDH